MDAAGILGVEFIGIFARVTVAKAFTRPKEFVEIVIVSFVDVIGVGFHVLCKEERGAYWYESLLIKCK
jgi:hypothetical protein